MVKEKIGGEEMRYSTDDQLQEVMRRKKRRKRRRDRQITGILSGTAACIVIASAAVVSIFSRPKTAYVADSAYGAFLLSSRSGSYVLCGVIAFVCGSLITILCVRRKRKQDAELAEKIKPPQSDVYDQDESTGRL